ncbi:MAG TPA: hypothetical protein H9884_06705 [Candidatus Yaniella excrementigallinarum]|nr:hypothetical protein [Candidatus Yaniella excrementigallinarum]
MNIESNNRLGRHRREGILIVIISEILAVLVVLDQYVFGTPKVSLVGIPFFGTCLFAGIFRAVRPGRQRFIERAGNHLLFGDEWVRRDDYRLPQAGVGGIPSL